MVAETCSQIGKAHKGIHEIELKFLAGIQLNPFTPKSDLIDLTLSIRPDDFTCQRETPWE